MPPCVLFLLAFMVGHKGDNLSQSHSTPAQLEFLHHFYRATVSRLFFPSYYTQIFRHIQAHFSILYFLKRHDTARGEDMISYEPLFRTMREKGITSYQLQKMGFNRATSLFYQERTERVHQHHKPPVQAAPLPGGGCDGVY